MPSGAELLETIPVILSLIVIEGLLSVDNSLAIAAMASRLPEEQRGRALNWGMAGAYGFRCICLLLAGWIIQNTWIKVAGAAYLIYLMCAELTGEDEERHHPSDAADQDGGDPAIALPIRARGFPSVVLGILLLDASLSVDNVIAAIALTPKLWAVYVGVGIGIVALRLLAGWAIRLIQKHPILEQAAFLLVGFVGFLLLGEMFAHIVIGPVEKLGVIVAILATCLLYEASREVRAVFRPIISIARWPMKAIASVVGWILWPFTKVVEALAGKEQESEIKGQGD